MNKICRKHLYPAPFLEKILLGVLLEPTGGFAFIVMCMHSRGWKRGGVLNVVTQFYSSHVSSKIETTLACS